MAEDLIGQFGYLGIILLLVLGGLGLPVPEEAPIILAAILSKKGAMWAPLALGACVVGVLIGDFVVYGLGYFYGERVLSFRLTRKLLTREREAQIKGYFQRHGLKILILGRFAVGFRTAAYLTAGILRHPPLKLLMTDLIAVSLSTPLMFLLGWIFAHQIEVALREAQHYLLAGIVTAILVYVLYRSYNFYQARRRAGRQVGPPVLVDEDLPPPPGDLAQSTRASEPPKPAEVPGPTTPAEPTPKPSQPDRQEANSPVVAEPPRVSSQSEA